ncbi:MAG: class I mannose-6-phosphate isomerase [Candidatus Riflebacteria bacterium]|nr:class I mannose-6-phosphate isomerase [Candidatus Riflebacteria bacterium]
MISPYPMALGPVAVGKVWGGSSLARFAGLTEAPAEPIGEIWSLSALDQRPTVVTNGPLAGMPLPEALGQIEGAPPAPFPLLVKVLEATTPISLQVHPSDAFARAQGFACGKSEAWLILKVGPTGRVLHGLRDGVSLPEFVDALERGAEDVLRCVRQFKVAEGDVIPILSGTVHATLGELVWAEVQQSSDLTYRLCDWGRTGRELHVDRAMAALDPRPPCPAPVSGLTLEVQVATRRLLVACRPFVMEEIHLTGHWSAPTRGHPFEILMGLRGKPQVECRGDSLQLLPGRSVLLPAPLPFAISSRSPGRLLRVYQADLESELRPALVAAGHSPERIATTLFSS